MKRLLLYSLAILLSVSCSKKITKPSYIKFQHTNDSLHVVSENLLKCPYQIVAQKEGKSMSDTLVIFPEEEKRLLSFSKNTMDTLTFLKQYKLKTAYGNSKMSTYDTLHPYELPFLQHKDYKILQGNRTNFTHNGRFSSYAIDFQMPIGDTICAARDGYVVGIIQHHNKHGNDKSFREFANYLTIYHDDGTFSQYVHLKQNGALVTRNQRVKKGEPIALSGHTGWSTQPHLHFAVFKVEPFEFVSIPFYFNDTFSTNLEKGRIMSH
ncbi:MAG: M23 family metallopeptidase [Algicola sp.]|nr:M23 family metallopeptidase [Algicola sp.]